jgi:hypothetical protein
MNLPNHKCGLYLTHNEHRDSYEKLEDKLQDEYHKDMSPEDKAECIRTDSLWTLHWYPNTPVSFYVVHGPTLERVLELAND